MVMVRGWLAGASSAAVALALAPMPAGAAVKHAAQRAAAGSQAAEIRALRAQVEALTARLDAQEQTQQAFTAAQRDANAQAQAQAAAAQAQAQAAQTQAAAAQQAVPDQVKTALAAQPKPKSGWWENTTISGRSYFNASGIKGKVNGVDTFANNNTAHGAGFNIKRFYLGIDHTFDSRYSANLTMDAANVVGQSNNLNYTAPATAGGYNLVGKGFFIKKAYLQAKFSPALIVRLGSADLPWIPYDEGIYGYRHIENTIIDRTGFGTSADWGVHVLGDLAGGIVSYQVSVVDGGGFRNVRVTNSVDVEGRVSVAYKGIFGAVGGYTGKLAQNAEHTGGVTFHTARRLDALAGYKTPKFTIGAEYFYAKDYNNNGVNYILTNVSDKGEGYAGFGSFQFTPKISVFGRYDRVKPRKNIPGPTDHYYNVGVQYSPAKIVDLALVYKRERTDNGTISTTNGTIGGTNRGTYDEFGLFGQFRF